MIYHAERLEAIHPYVKKQFEAAAFEIEHRFGYDLLVVFGKRTFEEQARIFRQGRSLTEIKAKAQQYRNNHLDHLADILMGVGPQSGKSIVTKAGPGESIHNYGLAIDYVRQVNGQAAWGDDEAYRNCTKVFKEFGFECGAEWKFVDKPHIQMTAGLGWRDLMRGSIPKFQGAE